MILPVLDSTTVIEVTVVVTGLHAFARVLAVGTSHLRAVPYEVLSKHVFLSWVGASMVHMGWMHSSASGRSYDFCTEIRQPDCTEIFLVYRDQYPICLSLEVETRHNKCAC